MRIKWLESFQQTLQLIPWDKRLRLSHLPQPIRRYAAQVVAVALTACLIILLFGLNLYPFETPLELPETLSPIRAALPIPFSIILLFILGLGLLARALYFASYQPGWALPVATRLSIGLLGLGLPLYLLDYSIIMTGIWNGTGWIQISLKLQSVFILLAILSGCAAILCAFLRQSRAARWAARFGMGSFLATALAFLLFKLSWDFLIRQNAINQENMVLIYSPLVSLVSYATPMIWILDIIFFWQVVTEAKLFSREIGLGVAKLTTRFPWLLTALFTVKGIWLLSGYVNAMRTGEGDPWTRSLQDGGLAKLLALLFALATGWWLLYRRKPTDSRHLIRGALFITAGFLMPFILAFLLFIPATLVLSLASAEKGLWLGTISLYLTELGRLWTLLFVSLLLPFGWLAQRLPRLQYLAPIAIVTGLWSLPVLLQQAWSKVDLAFDYLTFDTALTVVLFALLAIEWGWKLRRIREWMITIILVVSTLIALVENLLFSDDTLIGFALVLILPMIYQLFFDSEELNHPEPAQGQRIIRTIGFQALLMLVIAWAVTLGLMRPGQALWADVATRIFLPPFLLLYLTNTITHHESISLNDSELSPRL